MTSEHHWKQLCHVLQDERVAYEQLGTLLNEEWSLLRKLDYQGLVDITRRKEDVLTHIQRAEQHRMVCVRELSEDTNQETSLDWIAKSKLSDATPAKLALKKLVETGQQVKHLSDKNTGLISRGLHVVREAVNMVHEGLGLQPMYGQSGSLTFPLTSTSLNIKG